MNRPGETLSPCCLIGASGFVGQHLIRELRALGPISLRLLEHKSRFAERPDTTIFHGDMADQRSIEQLLVPDAIVVNLAYAGADSALRAAKALGNACASTPIRRLVHISTAMVVGDHAESVVNEEYPSVATDEYGKTKLKVEEILRQSAIGKFEISILRPTAVFGPGGLNLETLAWRVKFGTKLERSLRAMIMGRRHMHAIDVQSLAKAVIFIATADINGIDPVFFVANDEHPLNNYLSVESRIASAMGVSPLPSWLPCLPEALFQLLLRALGRTDSNPCRVYSSAKLRGLGFDGYRDLEAAIDEYAHWYSKSVTV